MLPCCGVRSYRTFSHLPKISFGRLFSVALHRNTNSCFFPYSRLRLPLAGILPCGARTFLIRRYGARDCPAYFNLFSIVSHIGDKIKSFFDIPSIFIGIISYPVNSSLCQGAKLRTPIRVWSCQVY